MGGFVRSSLPLSGLITLPRLTFLISESRRGCRFIATDTRIVLVCAGAWSVSLTEQLFLTSYLIRIGYYAIDQ